MTGSVGTPVVEGSGSPNPAPNRGLICLIGLRASGKSSVGRLLGQRLGVPFWDLDEQLARAKGTPGESAGGLLERVGQARFREYEAAALRSALENGGPGVLATGGGVILDPANREQLRRASFCVWLRASPGELLRRALEDGQARPALTDLSPAMEVEQLAREREAYYQACADLSCDTEGRELESIVNEIFLQLPQ